MRSLSEQRFKNNYRLLKINDRVPMLAKIHLNDQMASYDNILVKQSAGVKNCDK